MTVEQTLAGKTTDISFTSVCRFYLKKRLKLSKGYPEAVTRRWTVNTMTKRKRTTGQTRFRVWGTLLTAFMFKQPHLLRPRINVFLDRNSCMNMPHFNYAFSSVSQITNGVFGLLQAQSAPFITHDITGFVTSVTRRVPLVGQELLIVSGHLSLPTVFSGVRVVRSYVFCIVFLDHCLSLCPLCFDHCIVCPSNCGFWLPLWYFQTLLTFRIYFCTPDTP